MTSFSHQVGQSLDGPGAGRTGSHLSRPAAQEMLGRDGRLGAAPGFSIVMEVPPSLGGLFHGKSENNMDDDWGYPYFLGKPHRFQY